MSPNKSVNPFMVIVDRDGDAVELLSRYATEDVIFATIRHLNNRNPDDAPHSAHEIFDTSAFRYWE